VLIFSNRNMNSTTLVLREEQKLVKK